VTRAREQLAVFDVHPMSTRILIAEPLDFSQRAVALLQSAGDVELRVCTRDDLQAAFQKYDVVWFRLANVIDRTILSGPVRCRILATPVTGLDHIDLDLCRSLGIQVVSLRGEVEFLRTVRATAELTIGLLLALLRRIPAAAASVQAGVWNRDLFRGHELFGRTAGIVGLGRLGTIVASYLRAFGMDVLAYDPRVDFDHAVATRVDSLIELVQRADVVSLHVSYSQATRHLIGSAELAAMKPDAVLINTSRGGVIDEAALLAALQAGQLAGAALDVLDGEPDIGAAHPLVAYSQTRDNLLIVPHIGGNTRESFENTECFLAGRVVEALRVLAAAEVPQ
jgi:D-3-phosphoglycerate dehydrogenase / 2-oxoglutarate reductase